MWRAGRSNGRRHHLASDQFASVDRDEMVEGVRIDIYFKNLQ